MAAASCTPGTERRARSGGRARRSCRSAMPWTSEIWPARGAGRSWCTGKPTGPPTAGGASASRRRTSGSKRRSADDPDGFIVPQPLGHDDAVRTVWQAALSGTPLIDVVQGGECADFIERAARGLASLHGIDPGGLSRTTLEDRLAPVLAAAA